MRVRVLFDSLYEKQAVNKLKLQLAAQDRVANPDTAFQFLVKSRSLQKHRNEM